MRSVDVITKFTYLTHGQKAPRGSSFKGMVTTESILGFREYTERNKAKLLSEEAKHSMEQRHGFFGYTSTRVGATKTYSSDGWVESKEQDFLLREKIADAFCKDGHLLWTPVISLESFNVSFDNKLFNEEDYAHIMDKVLPKWFASAGFQKENMIWWIDHHVNTDNPHLHFSFLEKEKTITVGKLTIKDMNRFKTLFWNEVFSRQEFLNNVGQQAEDVFRQKDLLKKDIVISFSQALQQLDDVDIENKISILFEQLPNSGRLQYGSIHMKEHRSSLDDIVESILQQSETKEKYQEFMDSVSQFDSVRNENLHTKDLIMLKQEDSKLRKQLANMILKQYKSMMIDVKESAIQFNPDEYLYIPIAASLVKNKTDESVEVRLPGTGKTMMIEYSQLLELRKDKFYVAMLPSDFNQVIKDEQASEVITRDTIFQYFNDGKKNILPLSDSSYKNQEKDKELVQVLKQKELNKRSNESRVASTLQQAKHGSWSWMKKVQKEVEQAQEEFYRGKEMNLL